MHFQISQRPFYPLFLLLASGSFAFHSCDKPPSMSERGSENKKDKPASQQAKAKEPSSKEISKPSPKSPPPPREQQGTPADKTAKQTNQKAKTQKEPATKKRKPSLTELPVENTAPGSLPVDRKVTNTSGSSLDLTITARYEKEIAVVRKSDSKAFTLPITKLSKEDSAFVLTLPISKKPAKVDPFVTNRQKLIERHQKDILRLREKLVSGTLTTSQMRANVKYEKELEEKITEIKRQIKERQQ